MPKTPLNPSPLILHAQEFWDVSIQASTEKEHGHGDISVERQVSQVAKREGCWSVCLELRINAIEGEKPPPYTGQLVASGIYEVHPNYPHDSERLIRITGASMLYGAIRELVSSITARGPHGMLTLPSVSFYESDPEMKTTKKAVKKKSFPKKK